MKLPNIKALSTIKNFINAKTGRTILKIKKASPEIFLVLGIGGVVIGVFKACQATLKLEDVVDSTNENVNWIKENGDEKTLSKDVAMEKIKGGIEIAKLYAPSVCILTISIGSIVGSHKILGRRNVALMAAYKALQNDFNFYRANVIEDGGKEKDEKYRLGLKSETTTEVDENGNEKNIEQVIVTKNPYELSQYARYFDKKSDNFSETAEYNKTFLLNLQRQFNDLLHNRGHVFLNEVYDALDIPRSQAGQIVGWVDKKMYGDLVEKNLGQVDDYIDFGIFTIDSPAHRRFVSEDEAAILLDFNVAGVIYDMIEKKPRSEELKRRHWFDE